MGTNKDRIYCQICLFGCVAKHHARSKLKLDNVNFKASAKEWKNKNRKYTKVFGFVDWQNTFFFYWVFFHEHSEYTAQQEKGGGYLFNSSLTLPSASQLLKH